MIEKSRLNSRIGLILLKNELKLQQMKQKSNELRQSIKKSLWFIEKCLKMYENDHKTKEMLRISKKSHKISEKMFPKFIKYTQTTKRLLKYHWIWLNSA